MEERKAKKLKEWGFWVYDEIMVIKKNREFIEPTGFVKKKEKVLSEMSDFEKACYTWIVKTSKEIEGEIEKRTSHKQASEEEIFLFAERFSLKIHQGVAETFLENIKERLGLDDEKTLVGTRKGFLIVDCSVS